MDYVKDDRWIKWTQDALTLFVESQNVRPGGGDRQQIPIIDARPAVGPNPTRGSIPQERVYPKYNAANCMEENPDLFGMDTLFGSSIQEVNLDTMWEIITVSSVTRSEPICAWKQQLTYAH